MEPISSSLKKSLPNSPSNHSKTQKKPKESLKLKIPSIDSSQIADQKSPKLLSPDRKALNSSSPVQVHRRRDRKTTFFSKLGVKGVISKFYLAKKFIDILKNVTSQRLPKFLSRFHFQIINDGTFFYDVWKHHVQSKKEASSLEDYKEKSLRKVFRKIQKKLRVIKRKIKVFDNSSTFKIVWNVVHLMFILFFFILMPLEATFDIKLYRNFEVVKDIQFASVLFFLLDFLVNCNTAVYFKGKLEKNRNKIVEYYLKSTFIWDVISFFSVIMQTFNSEISDLNNHLLSFIRMLFFFRLINFSSIVKKLEEMIFIDQSIHNILSLFKLIFRIILLSHIFACLWHYIGRISENNSWITHYELTDASWWVKYLYSYYYVSVTMNTVGYGDITPQNPLETIFAIIFIYIACGVFAYSINSIGIIVSDLAKTETEFHKDLSIINEYMKQKRSILTCG